MATITLDENVYVTNAKPASISATQITTGTGPDGNPEVAVKVSVDSFAGAVRFNYTKTFIDVDPFVIGTPGEGDTGTEPDRRTKELTRRNTLTVSGFLSEASGTSALSKRNDFATLIKWGRVLTVVWGVSGEQQKFKGALFSAEITERPTGQVVESGKTIGASDFERNFYITFTLLISEDV